MDIQHTFVNVVNPAVKYILEIWYEITGDSENVQLYIYNIRLGSWEWIDNLSGAGWFVRTLSENQVLPDTGRVMIRFAQLDNDPAQTCLLIKHEAIASLCYGLDWEYRISNVSIDAENYLVKIKGYVEGNENVKVSIWNNVYEGWEEIGWLTGQKTTIKKFLENIKRYLNADNISVLFSDSLRCGDNLCSILHVDIAIIGENCLQASEIMFQVRVSSDGLNWSENLGPDGTPNTYFKTSPAYLDNIPDSRYIQYVAYLSSLNESFSGANGPCLHLVQIEYLPPAPLPVSPEDRTNTKIATLRWENLSPADYYWVQIDDDPDFSSPEYENLRIPCDQNFLELPALPNSFYYWRVRMSRGGEMSKWSQVRSFRIDTVPPNLFVSLVEDFEDADLEGWTCLAWEIATDKTHSGHYSSSNRDIGDNESAWIRAEVKGPATVTFWWAVSSEPYYDSLEFYIDDKLENKISGEVDWTKESSSLPPGSHTLTWVYRKDSCVTLGLDKGWIDDIEICLDNFFTSTSPLDGEIISDNAPNLDWLPVWENSTPVLYRVWVDDNADFSSPLLDSGWMVDDNYQLPLELEDGCWFWRFSVMDNAGNVSENSPTISFCIDTLMPTLRAPIDTLRTPDNRPILYWENLRPTDNFEIWIDNDPDFSSVICLENTPNTEYVPAELPDGTYFWRVRAYSSYRVSAFTKPWRFTVDAPPSRPIRISSDAEFVPSNCVSHGSGTVDDPYIIENWIIDASGGAGIYIESTTKHFILRNSIVRAGFVNLVYTSNGKIEDLFISTPENLPALNVKYSSNIAILRCTVNGISLYGSCNVALENSLVENLGIYVGNCDNVVLENNLMKNGWIGACLDFCTNCRMGYNKFENNTYNFSVRGSELPHFLHIVDNTNLVNGRPILYLVSKSNFVVESQNIGYLALVNCENIVAENLTIENNTEAVLIAYSTHTQLKKAFIRNHETGIMVYRSANLLIENCEISNTNYGVILTRSDNCSVMGCQITRSRTYAVFIDSSAGDALGNCLFTEAGIIISHSLKVLMENNRIENSSYIELHWSENCILRGNRLENSPGLYVEGYQIPEFIHTIDNSNLVNGKPILYLVDRSDIIISQDNRLGYLGLINCRNVVVENLRFENLRQPILLVGVSNSLIKNIQVNRCYVGLYMFLSENNRIADGVFENCQLYDVYVCLSGNNIFEANRYSRFAGLPGIHGIRVADIKYDSATVCWETDELSTSIVEYGMSSAYGFTKSDSKFVSSHAMTLTGLYPGTTYHFRVKSIDARNNMEASFDYIVTTLGLPSTSPAKSRTILRVEPLSFGVFSGGSIILIVTLTDFNNHPLAGKPISWSEERGLGTFDRILGTTNENGQVQVVYTAPLVARQEKLKISFWFSGDNWWLASSCVSAGMVLPLAGGSQNLLSILENLTSELRIPIERGNEEVLENCLAEGKLGACLIIRAIGAAPQSTLEFLHPELVEPEVRITIGERIDMIIDSTTVTGKTILFVVERQILPVPPEKIEVLFDGEMVRAADDYRDVLDPTNENTPEFLIIAGENGMQVLVSIPFFSEHVVTIRRKLSAGTLWGPIPLTLGIICIMLAVFYVSRRKYFTIAESRQMRISFDEEKELISKILLSLGVPEDRGKVTAEVLAEADLRGFSSHGILRLPYIVRAIKRGTILPSAEIKIVQETPATALVDGGHSLGHYVAYLAMQIAIQKAKAVGISAVGVRNSNHFGIAGYYAEMAMREGMIGIVTTTTDALVHPWGGAEPVLGTNALAVGIPSDPPVLLDMATSVAARGKIVQAAKEGKRIPLGWAVDEEGNPTTDPVRALRGALSPFGGAKGYGLGFVLEILAGPLVGASAGREVVGTLEPVSGFCTKGDLMIVINPSAFVDPQNFQALTRKFIEEVKNSRKAPGVQRIMIPGEPEYEERKRRLAEGITIPEEVWSEIENLKCELGVK
jgi:L-2-hydroxycarboxylate dehydrogenase (NAD+)